MKPITDQTDEESESRGWHCFVDRGGTFTDIVAIAPDGKLVTYKLLSENPARYEDAALAGIERIRAESGSGDEPLSSVRIGTTIGTNALLERRGARTVLVITEGFRDLLRIGTQQRPDIFALNIELPELLYASVVEARERIAADGSILTALDTARLARDLAAAREAGAESVAIALVNAYREPAHEAAAADVARAAGFRHVSVSSLISPEIKLVDRGDTAVVDAYLEPILETYRESLKRGLGDLADKDGLWFMQSHGGLIEADGFRACDSVLSGPAGGVVGMAAAAAEAGFEEVIGFDMGGTSTDVSVFTGAYERTLSARIAGCRIARPMLRINTVAAGGGSILKFRGGRLQVGPESAGAHPGPACYRNGGPLTLTDANVLLGRIQPDFFPSVFGPDGDQPIDVEAVERRFAELSGQVTRDGGPKMSGPEVAEGCLRIAITGMAAAIEQVSVQRGHDVTAFALACFGGAGGQHACGVADALGIETIIVHPLSGVLSAYGIGVAERRSIRRAGIHAELGDASLDAIRDTLDRLSREHDGEFDQRPQIECRLNVRTGGSDTLLEVPFFDDSSCRSVADAFATRHEQRFGFVADDDPLFVQSIDVEAVSSVSLPMHETVAGAGSNPRPVTFRQIRFNGEPTDTPVYPRQQLGPGTLVDGPAMIAEDNATIIVEPGWTASTDPNGILILSRTGTRNRREDVGSGADPVMLEIFGNRFMHVAEQMGVVLEQTAHSVNIKERLDYSCALFDEAGSLIANAPHVPVHLGSMGDSVREVIDSAGMFRRGDAWMLNAPYRGGTHLPDITVVSPVFVDGGTTPDFFVASRAHHADIGGTTPGSMPAASRTIDEEGVVIEPMQIVSEGSFLERRIRDVLATGDFPARKPDQNLADLKAQLAANAKGRSELGRLIGRYGAHVVRAYMQHVRDNAERSARDALKRLRDGHYSVSLDNGAKIAVAVTIDHRTGDARIDFDGTSRISDGNLNAPHSVVRAVVLYVLRTLISEDIPLNGGCLAPVDLRIPEQSLLDPVMPAAVAGGNVETSQCIADALLAAFGAAAASQGTMNNLTFGDAQHQYYETICGGSGAGPGFDGTSAVHSHMTNSRLTDVEVLEQRFPVRVRRFGIRRGSGGAGRWQGGDGVIREIEFLAPMDASLLANRRQTAPFGLAGGGSGLPGRDTVIRRDGSSEPILPRTELRLETGDRIRIETPGGGGYGRSAE